MALNVNLKTSVIISKHFNALLPLVCEVLQTDPRNLENITRANAFRATKIIKHLKVFTKHSKREVEYTIDALVDVFPQDARFDCKGKTITYSDYFFEQYGISLKRLPMVRTTKKKAHIPLELCHLKEGQFLNQTKIDANIQRDLLFKSTHTPNVYFHKVAKIINKIKEADQDKVLKEFGLDLDLRAARIEGRVLPTPRTLCSNQRDRLHKAANMPHWGVFCFSNIQYKKEDLLRFVTQMRDSARQIGINLSEPSFAECIMIKSCDDIKNGKLDLFQMIYLDNDLLLSFQSLTMFTRKLTLRWFSSAFHLVSVFVLTFSFFTLTLTISFRPRHHAPS